MKHCVYRPTGVCSQKIEFDLDNGVIRNVAYTGGCNGNLKAVSALVEGQDALAASAAASKTPPAATSSQEPSASIQWPND